MALPEVSAALEFGGTATTLLRVGPFTLLTDPNFLHQGQRAYLGYGLWTRRRTEPAIRPESLPPLDAVLLSHLHGDHFDRIAKKRLDRRPPILTTHQAARRLRRWHFDAAQGLDPWASSDLVRDGERLRITSVPGTHGPGPLGKLLPPVMGSVLELDRPGRDPLRIYLTGDVLYRPALHQVLERFGRLDAMVIHLGGTRVLGITVTMDARQGADLVGLLGPAVTVPIHYDDYRAFRSPLDDFVAEVARRALGTELRVVGRGQTVGLGPVGSRHA